MVNGHLRFSPVGNRFPICMLVFYFHAIAVLIPLDSWNMMMSVGTGSKLLSPYKPLELVPSCWASSLSTFQQMAKLLLAASTSWRSPDSGMYFLVPAHLGPSIVNSVPSLRRKCFMVSCGCGSHGSIPWSYLRPRPLVHCSRVWVCTMQPSYLCATTTPPLLHCDCSTAQSLILWGGYG